MDCFYIKEKLTAWVDDELPSREAEAVNAHLRQCPACRLEAEGVRQLVSALNDLPVIPAPMGFSRRARRSFKDSLVTPGIIEWWRELTLATRGAVCCTILVGLLFGAILGAGAATYESDTLSNPYQLPKTTYGLFP